MQFERKSGRMPGLGKIERITDLRSIWEHEESPVGSASVDLFGENHVIEGICRCKY